MGRVCAAAAKKKKESKKKESPAKKGLKKAMKKARLDAIADTMKNMTVLLLSSPTLRGFLPSLRYLLLVILDAGLPALQEQPHRALPEAAISWELWHKPFFSAILKETLHRLMLWHLLLL